MPASYLIALAAAERMRSACRTIDPGSMQRRKRSDEHIGECLRDLAALIELRIEDGDVHAHDPPALESRGDDGLKFVPAKTSRHAVVPGWQDRKSVVWGKSVSGRVDLGGRRIIKKKKNTT